MRNASDIEWLLWAEDRELLTPLFSRKTVQDPRIIVLAYWFARKYVLKHPEVALGVLERQGQILSQTLWYEVARSLHSINDPDSNSFSKWLTILIDQSTYEDNVKLLEYLFNKAAKAGSWPLALRLFEYLTRPHIKFDKSSSFFSSGHRDPTPTISKIYIRGSHHWLKNGWENTFKPHLKEIARDVVLLTSSNIRMAYDLSVCHGISNIGWDVLNFQKSAIEPHEQDHLNYAFNIVIDACRDSLEWLLVHNRSVAIFLIKEWILTPVPLLRRLAIYGMNLDKKKSPDLKLKWAVNHKLVSYNLVHHELFQMLQHVYPLSSKPVKKAFLEQARIATKEEIKEHPGDDPAMFWHGLFELLSWLDKASKVKCPLVRNRLIRLKKKYPTFKVSDHPDFTHWLGEVTWGAKSPITIEGLLEQPLEDSISLLLSFKEDSFSGPSRGGLMSILSTSVTQDPDWGLQLAKNLLKKRLKPDNVWSSILSGWSAADLNEKQWKDILNLIDKNAMLLEHEHVMTHVLERGISIEKHHLPYSLLPIAERIGNKLWNVVASKKKPPTTASTDWLQTAINEPGGVLTKFFLTAISIRRKHVGISWTIIPKNLKSQLGQIASGRSYASEMGRVLLVSHLHFLYACDAKWTMTKVLPLLSWKKNKKKAVQAWHGYLFWGKWYDEYLPDLLPLYEQGFTRLNKDLINVRERFVEHIASICVFSTRNTARGRWLNHFLRSVDSTDLREFAGSIKKMLWSLDQDKAEKAWRKWLDAYWEKRLSGKPVPLEKEEASKMAEWAPHMGCMFPEVVKKICRTQLELSVDSFIYHMLNEKNIPATYPKATVDLLLCLVRTSYEAMYDYVDLEDVIKELVNHSETHEILKQVLDYMSSKGSIIASKYNLELT